VLPDEQASWLIIELLADLFAELLADFAAARAQALRFGQRLLNPPSRQVGRQFLRPWPGRFGLAGSAALWLSAATVAASVSPLASSAFASPGSSQG